MATAEEIMFGDIQGGQVQDARQRALQIMFGDLETEPPPGPGAVAKFLAKPLPFVRQREPGEPGFLEPLGDVGLVARAGTTLERITPRTIGEAVTAPFAGAIFIGRGISTGIIEAGVALDIPTKFLAPVAAVFEETVIVGLTGGGRPLVGAGAAVARRTAAGVAATAKVIQRVTEPLVRRFPHLQEQVRPITQGAITDVLRKDRVWAEAMRDLRARNDATKIVPVTDAAVKRNFKEIERIVTEEMQRAASRPPRQLAGPAPQRALPAPRPVAPAGVPVGIPRTIAQPVGQAVRALPPELQRAAFPAVGAGARQFRPTPPAPRQLPAPAPQLALPAPKAPAAVAPPAPAAVAAPAVAGTDEAALAGLTRNMPVVASATRLSGGTFTASTPITSAKVSGSYVLTDLDEVIHSFKPGYQANLQPRITGRLSMENKIASIQGRFDPTRLGESATTETGAPIVAGNLNVMAGNTRVEALSRIYSGDPTKAQRYRDWLKINARKFGFDPAEIDRLERPILLRKIDDFDRGLTLERFLNESNQPQIQLPGAAEQAIRDAEVFRNNARLYNPVEGNVFARENQGFIKKFVADASNNEAMLTKEGINRAEVSRRLKSALMVDAIGPEDMNIIQSLIETPAEEGLGRLATAITKSAVNIARVRQTPLSLSEDLKGAIQDLIRMDAENVTLEQLLAQQQLFGAPHRTASQVELLRVMETGTSKQISSVLDDYVERAGRIDQTTGDFFGGDTDKAVLLESSIQNTIARMAGEDIERLTRIARADRRAVENLKGINASQKDIALLERKALASEQRLQKRTNAARMNEASIERNATSPEIQQINKDIDDYGAIGGLPRSLGAAAAREKLPAPTPRMAEEMVLTVRQAISRGGGASFEHPIREILSTTKGTATEAVEQAMAARFIPPRILQGILDLVAHPEKIGKVNSLAWFRPPPNVLREVGLTPIAEMFEEGAWALLNELSAMSKRVIDIYKRGGFKRLNTKSIAAFRVLNGQSTPEAVRILGAEGMAAVEEIRQVFRELAVKFGLPEQRIIEDYITHVIRRGNPELIEPELYSGLRFVGDVKSQFLKERLGATGYIEDTVTAVDTYIRAGFKDLYLSKPTAELKGLLRANKTKMPPQTVDYLSDYLMYQIGSKWDIETKLGHFVTGLAGTMKSLAKVTGMKGVVKTMDELIQAPPHMAYRRGASWLRGNIFVGALGLAADSALTNLTQGLNTFSEFGVRVFLRGYRELAKSKLIGGDGRQALIDSGVFNTANWRLVIEQTPIQIKQALGDKFMFMFQAAENVNRGSAFLGVYYGALEGTLSARTASALGLQAGVKATREVAMRAGRQAAEITQFNYLTTGTPLFFQSPLGKWFGQLGSFAPRQIEFLSPIAAGKAALRGDLAHQDVQRMARYMVATAVIYQMAHRTGIDLRDNVFPIVPDPERPLGFTAGFAKFGVGILPQIGIAFGATMRGRREGFEELKRTSALLVPGGRTFLKIPTTIQRGGGPLEFLGLRRFAAREPAGLSFR